MEEVGGKKNVFLILMCFPLVEGDDPKTVSTLT